MVVRRIAKFVLRAAAPALMLALLVGGAAAQGNRLFPPMQPPGSIPGPQGSYPSYPGTGNQQAAPPAQQNRNPVCLRLEGQLAALDGNGLDPARNEQVRRFEDAAGKQQVELDRIVAQHRRLGCEGGFFSLLTGQNPQCTPLTNQISQMRGNLDRILSDLERLRGGSNSDREGQRRALVAALGQNDCGAQYARGGGFLETLLNPGGAAAPDVPSSQSSTFRTLCVRTCDGYYFPISFATSPGRFTDDENTCQRLCPASEVTLYTHRNPGEEMNQAVSLAGRPYTEMPNAFAYRKAFNKACSCRASGQSWADALKHLDDRTVERGDIVVTEERAKQMSQPTPAAKARPPAKGTPAQKAAVAPPAEPLPAPPAPPLQPAASEPADGKRNVRSVGPTFIQPAR